MTEHRYATMDAAACRAELTALQAAYDAFAARGLKLDLSRGKPEAGQLDLSLPVLHALDDHDFISEEGFDVRNYGAFTGLVETKRLFGELFCLPPEQVLMGGCSSINLIHDALTRAFLNGVLPGMTPWSKLDTVKFICPVPGYDWHFHMCETMGIEMLPVEIGADGPDMDEVERLVKDPAVKGMICVPMYSNPTGVTYSEETVTRLAQMETAAEDFRIFWDNAYCVHHLYEDDRDTLADLYAACRAAGHEDRPLLFTSTSKITFAGSGVCAMGASPANIAHHSALLMYQLVCFDKMNQLRHARIFPTAAAVEAHMRKHAAILRPKFELVDDVLTRELTGLATWKKPKGGYFVCFYAPEGCAQRIVALCREAGVTLTPAGASYPHGVDPRDSVIRIAPSYPPMEELALVMELFPIAVKMAALEKRLAEQA